MCQRQFNLLLNRGISFLHGSPQVVNVSQSNTSGGTDGCCPTLTPRGVFWLCHRARRLLGGEALALQCIHLTEAQLDLFPDALCRDLAGNAFNAVCCQAAVLSLMVTTGRLHRASQPLNLGICPMLHRRLAAGEWLSSDSDDSCSDDGPC